MNQFTPYFELFPEPDYATTKNELASNRVKIPAFETYHFDPLHWDRLPTKDIFWRFQLHCLCFLFPLLYSKEHEDRAEALRWIGLWIRDQHSRTSIDAEYAWYPHAVAYRTLVFTYVCNRSITDNENHSLGVELINEISKHRDFLDDPDNAEFTNHGLIQGLALLESELIVNNDSDRSPKEPFSSGMTRLKKVLETNVSQNGVHRDHSPFYQFYSNELWFQIAVYLEMNRKSGRYSLEFQKQLLRVLPRMVDAAYYQCDSDYNLPTIGDTVYGSVKNHFIHYRRMLKQLKSKYTVDESEEMFIDEDGGFAVFKDTNSKKIRRYVAFNIQKTRPIAHIQNDVLSVFVSISGREIFTDAGMYSYNNDDPIRRYMRSWFAHNTAGKTNFYLNNIILAKEFTVSRDKIKRFSASVDRKTTGFDWNREVSLPSIGVKRIVITDTIYGCEGYMLRWHLGDTIDIDSLIFYHGDHRICLSDIDNTLIIEIESDKTLDVQIFSAQREPFMLGWRSKYRNNVMPCNVLVLRPKDFESRGQWTVQTAVSDNQRSMSIG